MTKGWKRRHKIFLERRGGKNNMRRMKEQVLLRDGNRCRECGKQNLHGSDCTLDHITPFFRGGTNDVKNLRILCRDCHNKKTNFEILAAGVHKLYAVILKVGPFVLMKRRTDVHA
jgi:5-methylcytosine-specific restriction endonuclease McrA